MPSNHPRPYPSNQSGPIPGRRPAAQRRADRAERDEQHWAARYAEAVTPAQVAAVDFDRLRSTLKKLEHTDPQLAARYWAELSSLLRKLRHATQRNVAPRRR
jgi:hypothetical protein